MAAFKSESWPASNRNGGRLQLGKGGRLQLESADATLAANVDRVTENRKQAWDATESKLVEAKASAEIEIATIKKLAIELSPAAQLAFAEWVREWDMDVLQDVVLGWLPVTREPRRWTDQDEDEEVRSELDPAVAA